MYKRGVGGKTGWGIFIPSTAARKAHSYIKFIYTLRVYGPGANFVTPNLIQIPEPAVTLKRHHTHTQKDVLGWKKQMILQTKTNIEMSPMHIHYALKCAYGD